MSARAQSALWCSCGRAAILFNGRCAKCYYDWKYDRRFFDGLRQRVLARDGRTCLGCGDFNPERIIVHHRRPGVHRMRFLVSLCRACHVRVHRTWRPGYGFPDFLRLLWREQYPDLAEQVELPLDPDSPQIHLLASQPSLFATCFSGLSDESH